MYEIRKMHFQSGGHKNPGRKQDRPRFGWAALALFTGLGSIASGLQAGEAQNFGHRAPSREEFIDALTPAPKLRGIRPISPNPPEAPKAVSMELSFEFNSATLSNESRSTLDNLGAAMQGQELKNYKFRIEGYTDSKGSAAYNMRLSERRALSVKSYLVEHSGIEATRLNSMGYGEESPLDPKDPENPANRRVQIVNLGD